MGTNSYVSEAEFTAYATTDRGITISGTKAVLLIKAMDWLEVQPFRGFRAVSTQALQFPRVLSYGIEYYTGWMPIPGYWADGTTVPDNIKKAQMAYAVILDGGGSLLAGVERAVQRESIAGAIDITYASSAAESIRYPELNLLLKEYLESTGGSFVVNRG